MLAQLANTFGISDKLALARKLGVLQVLGTMKVADINRDVVVAAAKELDFPLTDEWVDTIISTVQSGSPIDTIADHLSAQLNDPGAHRHIADFFGRRRKCHECGRILSNKWSFCPECGDALQDTKDIT